MEILDDLKEEQSNTIRRRKLLPWWIKVFAWIFLIFGSLAPIGLIMGVLGFNFDLALYGVETRDPISIIGFVLISIFVFKWITAFGLWTGKDWAIKFGQIDAIIGIAICIFVMVVYPFIDNSTGFHINLRIELLLLIPYYIKLRKIKQDWIKADVPIPDLSSPKSSTLD